MPLHADHWLFIFRFYSYNVVLYSIRRSIVVFIVNNCLTWNQSATATAIIDIIVYRLRTTVMIWAQWKLCCLKIIILNFMYLQVDCLNLSCSGVTARMFNCLCENCLKLPQPCLELFYTNHLQYYCYYCYCSINYHYKMMILSLSDFAIKLI